MASCHQTFKTSEAQACRELAQHGVLPNLAWKEWTGRRDLCCDGGLYRLHCYKNPCLVSILGIIFFCAYTSDMRYSRNSIQNTVQVFIVCKIQAAWSLVSRIATTSKLWNPNFIQHALQQKSHLCIPRKGIERPQSQFPRWCNGTEAAQFFLWEYFFSNFR